MVIKPDESSELGTGDAAATPLSIVALDDDADFREYMADLLEGEGHDVRTVGTPAELYATNAERLPDVVLLDMNMGASSGLDVLETLRSRWPKLCVIVLTGYPSMTTMRETFKQDVFDYLTKPFEVDEMRRVLQDAATQLGLGGKPQDRLRQQLGKHIRLARTGRDWTLKDLSEASGVSVSQLSSIERGAHLPSLESLLVIADALGVKPSAWLVESGF